MIKSIILLLMICFCLTSCKIDEIEPYNSKRSLFFPKLHPKDSKITIDSLYVSFSHHNGKDELKIPFTVSLVGQLLDKDMEYVVSVDKEKTTAQEIDYILPEKCIFRKGQVSDTLWVTVKKANLKDKEVLLVMKVTENETFTPGYYNRQIAKLAFNNIISQPTWWNEQITDVFFGVYSYKKFVTIIDAAAEKGIEFISTEDLKPSEIRKIALIAKDYISKNEVKEEDGTEMIILVY